MDYAEHCQEDWEKMNKEPLSHSQVCAIERIAKLEYLQKHAIHLLENDSEQVTEAISLFESGEPDQGWAMMVNAMRDHLQVIIDKEIEDQEEIASMDMMTKDQAC